MVHQIPSSGPTELQATLLLAAASDLFMAMDASGYITFASPACETMLNYTPEELIGRSAFDLVHPDDLLRLQGIFQQVLDVAGPDQTLVTYRCLRRDGSVCWVEGHTRIARQPATGAVQEFYLVARDVTTRWQLEQQLREQNDLLDALFVHSPVGIFVLRAVRDAAATIIDFTFERVNIQARNLIDAYYPQPLVGPTLLTQYPLMHDSPLLAGYQQALLTGKPLTMNQSSSRYEGDTLYHVVAVPLNAEQLAVSFLELRPPPGTAATPAATAGQA